MINKWHVKVLFCMPFIISEHTCSYEIDRTETIGRDAIDRVFVPLHAALHHGMGLCLKHLCDWVLLVQQEGGKLPVEPEDPYFKRTVTALTLLCHRYLGLDIPVKGEEDLADEMMREILRPPYFRKIPTEDSLKAYGVRLRNRIHIFRLKHRLLGVSFWGKLRGLLVRKMKEGKH